MLNKEMAKKASNCWIVINEWWYWINSNSSWNRKSNRINFLEVSVPATAGKVFIRSSLSSSISRISAAIHSAVIKQSWASEKSSRNKKGIDANEFLAAGIKTPVIEVHISNVFAREDYRHVSYLGKHCKGSISGFGLKGYEMAIESFL